MKRFLLIIYLSFITTACNAEPKTIDSTTAETLKTSSQAAASELPEQKRQVFAEALQVVLLANVSLADVMAAGALGEKGGEMLATKYGSAMNGMTATDVVKKAQEITDEKLATIKTDANSVEVIKAELSKVDLSDVTISKKKNSLDIDEATIQVTVKNGLSQAISRVYFQGIVSTEGRSTPWIKDSVNYDIAGGIEPNETKKLEFRPNMFAWPTENIPSGAKLDLTLEQVDDAKGEPLFKLPSNDQTKELAALQDRAKLFKSFFE